MKRIRPLIPVIICCLTLTVMFGATSCKTEPETMIETVIETVTETVTETVIETVEALPMEGWVIGYLPGSLRDNARVWASEAMEERVREAGAEDFIIIDSDYDIGKQVADGEDILEIGIDILILNANDADAMVPIVEKANEKGVPVVCFDRKVSSGDIVSTISTDSWSTGEGSAEFIVEKLTERYGEPKGKILHIQGSSGASVVYERGESFRQVIANYTDIEIIGEPFANNWTADEGLAFTEDALTAHLDLDAIYTHTDTMTLGAFNAVKAADKLDQVIIVGQDFYSGIPDIIKEGKYMVYSWAIDAWSLGYATADVCIEVAEGKLNEIPKEVRPPKFFVTPENIDEYMKYSLDLEI